MHYRLVNPRLLVGDIVKADGNHGMVVEADDGHLAEIAIRQYLQRTYIRCSGSRIELLCFQGPANSH